MAEAVWSKRTEGGFWSTASLTLNKDGSATLYAQEYRDRVSVDLTAKDVQRLRETLQHTNYLDLPSSRSGEDS